MFSQLFPLKDTTLYSQYPQMNAGLDEILELSKPNSTNADRILIEFDEEEILQTLNTISGSSYKAYLRMYASEVEALPTKLTVLANPIANDWDMGTGASYNSPITTNGASWLGPKTGSFWTTSSILQTSSFLSSSVAGGGSWYIQPQSSQSITQYTSKDIWMDVTDQVEFWKTNPNYGLILRVTESIENNVNYQYKATYFSRDTNTIYPPSLMVFWNDSIYNPYTASYTKVLVNDEFDISIGNNDGVYYAGEEVKFYVYARDKYPQRQFVTSSLYEYNKLMPSQSFYQIIDVDTNETIIPFNNPGTLISTETASYFKVDMSTFEPERWYQIQIKTTVNGGTYIKSSTDTKFKVAQTVM